MIPNHAFTAQIAHERQRDLIAQAQGQRLAAQARLPQRPWRRIDLIRPWWHRILLRVIRPALPGRA
jgi:hypothetical protein